MKHFWKQLILAVLIAASPLGAAALELKESAPVAVLSGQNFEIYAWSPSGYLRLLASELEKAGVKAPIPVAMENQKTAQMLARADADVIAKKPRTALIIPGTADYNPFAQKTVDESFGGNLSAVIEKLKAAQIRPVLATSLAVNSNPGEPRNRNVTGHNDAIRALAKEHGVALVDLAAAIGDAKLPVPLDGSLAAKAVINQMFAGEVLRALGTGDAEIGALRRAWLDKPGAVRFPPSVSVNTYEKLKAAAGASGKDAGDFIAEILHQSVQ